MSRLEVELFDPPPDPDLVCAICQCVMTEPMEASRCRHVFCRACIETWLGGGARTCPTCRAVLTTFDLCRALPLLYNVIGRLMMQCINKAAGCDARLAVERLDMHLQNDCQWVTEPCQCGQNVLRRDRETHMFSCEFCVVRCTGVCELMLRVRDRANHDCVAALKQTIEEQKQTLTELTRQLEAATALNKRLEKQLRDGGQLPNVQQSAPATAPNDYPVDDLVRFHSPATTESEVSVHLPESSTFRASHSERDLEEFVSTYFNPNRSPAGNNAQLDAGSRPPLSGSGNFYGPRNPFSWRFAITPPRNVPTSSSQRFATNNPIAGSFHRRNSDFESRPAGHGSAFHVRHSLLSSSLSPPSERNGAMLRPEVLVRLRLGNRRQSSRSQTPASYSPTGDAEHSPQNVVTGADDVAVAAADDAAVVVIPAHSLSHVDEHDADSHNDDDEDVEDGNGSDVMYENPENSPDFAFNHDSRSDAASVDSVASPMSAVLNDSHSIHFSSNPPSVDSPSSELLRSPPHSRPRSEPRSDSPTEFEDHDSTFELDVHRRSATSTPASLSNNSDSERHSSVAGSHFTERDRSPRSRSRTPDRSYHSDSDDSWYSSSRRHLRHSGSLHSFSPSLSSNDASRSPVSEHLAFNRSFRTPPRRSTGAATEFSGREQNRFLDSYVCHPLDVDSNLATDRTPDRRRMNSPSPRTPVPRTHSSRSASRSPPRSLSPHFSPEYYDRSRSPGSHFHSRYRSPSYFRLSRSPASEGSIAPRSPGFNPSPRSNSNISLDYHSPSGSQHSYVSYHSPGYESPEYRRRSPSPGYHNFSSYLFPESHRRRSRSPDPHSPESRSHRSSRLAEHHLTPSTHTPSSQHSDGHDKAAATNAVSDVDSNSDDDDATTSYHSHRYRVPASTKRFHSDSSDSEDGSHGNHKKLRHS